MTATGINDVDLFDVTRVIVWQNLNQPSFIDISRNMEHPEAAYTQAVQRELSHRLPVVGQRTAADCDVDTFVVYQKWPLVHRAPEIEIEALVHPQVVRMLRRAVFFQIGRGSDYCSSASSQKPCMKIGICQRSHAYCDIHRVAVEINDRICKGDIEYDLGISLPEFGKHRQ